MPPEASDAYPTIRAIPLEPDKHHTTVNRCNYEGLQDTRD